MNPLQALGLPERSVRALLALGLTGAAIYKWVTGQPIDETETALTTAALTYYFATRSAESPGPQQQVNLDAVDLLAKQRGIKP